MHKVSGLNLCNFYSNFYLTKCGGRGIIETPAEPSARGAPSKKEPFGSCSITLEASPQTFKRNCGFGSHLYSAHLSAHALGCLCR